MLRNVYGPLSGGIGQEKVLEILSNNIANAGTTAFKEETVSFSALGADPWPAYASPLPPAPFKVDMREVFPLRGNEMGYTALANVTTSHVQGSLRQTGNPLDVAIQGDGFFAVNTPFGERYTRDGSFSLTPEGALVTKTGQLVQGENGPLTGLSEGDVRILPGGEVYAGDRFVDMLKVVAFEDKGLLQKLGANLYVHDGAPENARAAQGEVSQGYLESSNANPMRNLTNMIVAHRTYEALQKAIKSHDESMGLSSRVGDVQG
jgi:flagellar basal-body rod protein FlgF